MDLDEFIDWLTEEGSSYFSIPDYLDGFCRFLNCRSFSIRRCNLATQTVHPQMVAVRHLWSDRALEPVPIPPELVLSRRQYWMGDAMIDEVFFNQLNTHTPQYRASPFHALDYQDELYEAVAPEGSDQRFPVFEDLAKERCTAYFGCNLHSFEGIKQQIGLATSKDGGLTASDLNTLRRALRLFSLHLNTLMEYEIKNILAATYLGRDPGQRVCSGMIKLGDVASIEAAIWFSDLRGFTEAGNRLAPTQLVEELNAYLGAVVTEIDASGGEVLKFIGDAILAVFPVSRHGSREAACSAAVSAALRAEAALGRLNSGQERAGRPTFAHGVALHFGQAQYGNVGTPRRLDFTVIGTEVNLASRIEALTKTLGRPIICSQAFIRAGRTRGEDLGLHSVKGFSAPVRLFALSATVHAPPKPDPRTSAFHP